MFFQSQSNGCVQFGDCNLFLLCILCSKEYGNESYMLLSGDYSGMPVMKYLVTANAWGLQRLSLQTASICLKGRKATD